MRTKPPKYKSNIGNDNVIRVHSSSPVRSSINVCRPTFKISAIYRIKCNGPRCGDFGIRPSRGPSHCSGASIPQRICAAATLADCSVSFPLKWRVFYSASSLRYWLGSYSRTGQSVDAVSAGRELGWEIVTPGTSAPLLPTPPPPLPARGTRGRGDVRAIVGP